MRRQTLMLLRSLIKTPEPRDRHKLRLVKMNTSVATKIIISLINFLCSRFVLNTQRTSGLSLDYLLLCVTTLRVPQYCFVQDPHC